MPADRPNARKRKHLYRELLDRDGPWCHYCGVMFEQMLHKRRMTIDHKTPLARDGNSELYNLVLACSTCNSRKGNRLAEEFFEDPLLVERRISILGQALAHWHESILFTKEGHWSCLCGAHGKASEDPKTTRCMLVRYGAFYRPTN